MRLYRSPCILVHHWVSCLNYLTSFVASTKRQNTYNMLLKNRKYRFEHLQSIGAILDFVLNEILHNFIKRCISASNQRSKLCKKTNININICNRLMLLRYLHSITFDKISEFNYKTFCLKKMEQIKFCKNSIIDLHMHSTGLTHNVCTAILNWTKFQG